ncbi:hypothetical protein MY10362_004346 [Beauveria mimosiformis]
MHNIDFDDDDDDDDDDIILTLIPHDGKGYRDAEKTATLPENQRFLRHAPGRSIPLRANHNEQDGTDTDDQSEREDTAPLLEEDSHSDTHCLVLRFSQGCKTTTGLIAGSSRENADLLLPRSIGMGKRHLAFTFDAMNVPIVRDLESVCGIKVIYDGEQRDRLKNFHWSLVGPSIAGNNLPVLNITDKILFKVKVPKRDFSSPSYVEKVKKFRQGTADPEKLFASINLPTTEGSTRIPTGQQSPLDGRMIKSIFVTRPLGDGSFGAVKYYWNVASRDEFVVKKPSSKTHFDMDMWKREAVALLEATFDPLPKLRLEYIPGGSLTSEDRLSERHGAQILSQLSSALDYLHTLNPPISHRDIKPENILVVERTVDNIYVKFGDFGLSKESEQLMTNCGTPVWNNAESWVRKFREYFVNKNRVKHSKLLALLLDRMIVLDGAKRSSAGVIHREVERILGQGLSSKVDEGESQGTATPMPRNMDGELTPRPGVNKDSRKQRKSILQVLKSLNDGGAESRFFGSKDASGETVPSDTQQQLAIDLEEAFEAQKSCSPTAGSYQLAPFPEKPEMASIPRTHLGGGTKVSAAEKVMPNEATVIAHCDADGKVQANGGGVEPIDGSRVENVSYKRKWPKDPSAGNRPVVERQVSAAGKRSREHKRTKTDE